MKRPHDEDEPIRVPYPRCRCCGGRHSPFRACPLAGVPDFGEDRATVAGVLVIVGVLAIVLFYCINN